MTGPMLRKTDPHRRSRPRRCTRGRHTEVFMAPSQIGTPRPVKQRKRCRRLRAAVRGPVAAPVRLARRRAASRTQERGPQRRVELLDVGRRFCSSVGGPSCLPPPQAAAPARAGSAMRRTFAVPSRSARTQSLAFARPGLLRNITVPPRAAPACKARNSASVCTAFTAMEAWETLGRGAPGRAGRGTRLVFQMCLCGCSNNPRCWSSHQNRVPHPAALGSCSCDSILSCCS